MKDIHPAFACTVSVKNEDTHWKKLMPELYDKEYKSEEQI